MVKVVVSEGRSTDSCHGRTHTHSQLFLHPNTALPYTQITIAYCTKAVLLPELRWFQYIHKLGMFNKKNVKT